jgi:hypothetical protein
MLWGTTSLACLRGLDLEVDWSVLLSACSEATAGWGRIWRNWELGSVTAALWGDIKADALGAFADALKSPDANGTRFGNVAP